MCYYFLLFIFLLMCVCLFRAPPVAYGGSQDRGRIGAAVSAYTTNTATQDPTQPCLRPTPQLMAMPDP